MAHREMRERPTVHRGWNCSQATEDRVEGNGGKVDCTSAAQTLLISTVLRLRFICDPIHRNSKYGTGLENVGSIDFDEESPSAAAVMFNSRGQCGVSDATYGLLNRTVAPPSALHLANSPALGARCSGRQAGRRADTLPLLAPFTSSP